MCNCRVALPSHTFSNRIYANDAYLWWRYRTQRLRKEQKHLLAHLVWRRAHLFRVPTSLCRCRWCEQHEQLHRICVSNRRKHAFYQTKFESFASSSSSRSSIYSFPIFRGSTFTLPRAFGIGAKRMPSSKICCNARTHNDTTQTIYKLISHLQIDFYNVNMLISLQNVPPRHIHFSFM